MKPEVVHLIKTIEVGGAENQLLKLAGQQVRDRRVLVLYFDGNPTLETDLLDLGVEVVRMPPKLLSKIRLINIKANSGAIIHTHLPHAELFCLFFLRNASRLVTTRHVAGPYSRRVPELIGLVLLNLVVARSKRVISISEVVKEDIRSKTRFFRTLWKKLYVIYYGFTLQNSDYTDHINKKKFLNTNAKIILGTISRLEKQKNIDNLIYAIKILNQDVELRIIGEGTQRDYLKSLVEKLVVNNCVKFLGKTRQVNEFLDSLDIFVLSSKYEGFGIVLVEATSRGIPILTSDIPICKEVLGNQGAIFFNPASPDDIAEKVNQAIKEFPMKKYVWHAKEMISRFDEQTLILKTDQVYASLKVNKLAASTITE